MQLNGQIDHIKTVNGGKRVLLVGWPERDLSIFTGVLGTGTRLRGSDARILQCDAALQSCEVYPELLADIAPFISPLDEFPCDRCQRYSKQFPEKLRLPTFFLSKYVRDSDYTEAYEAIGNLELPEILTYHLEEMNLGEHVRTTLHLSFQVGTLADDEVTYTAGRRLLATAIQLACGFKRLMEDFQPEVVVIYHGIYLMRGTCLEVFKKNGIRVICWDPVYTYGGIEMSHGDTYHHEFRLEPWQAWENLQLTSQQEMRLEAFLAERSGHIQLREAMSQSREEKNDAPSEASPMTKGSILLTVVLFTNISWDGRVKVDSSLYDGPAEWVIDTLRHLAHRKDLKVIVRIHPHETLQKPWRRLKRTDEELLETFQELPKNVTLVLPENPVSSYALAELANVVIVYSTLMGLEALAMGRQVIITGDAYYSNKGFGIQPVSREEYLGVLDRLDEFGPLETDELKRVRRYAYHFFFRRWLKLPFPPPEGDENWLSEDLRELMPGSSNALDRACEGILHGTPFHIGAP